MKYTWNYLEALMVDYVMRHRKQFYNDLVGNYSAILRESAAIVIILKCKIDIFLQSLEIRMLIFSDIVHTLPIWEADRGQFRKIRLWGAYEIKKKKTKQKVQWKHGICFKNEEWVIFFFFITL